MKNPSSFSEAAPEAADRQSVLFDVGDASSPGDVPPGLPLGEYEGHRRGERDL